LTIKSYALLSLSALMATVYLFVTGPSNSGSVSEKLEVLATALRNGFRDAYADYIEKTKIFSSPPEVGKKWRSQC
jgi:hypothetical protein